jgi:hypothetical protein
MAFCSSGGIAICLGAAGTVCGSNGEAARGATGLDCASNAVEAPADMALAAPTKCRRFMFINTIPGWGKERKGLRLTLSITTEVVNMGFHGSLLRRTVRDKG